MNTPMSAEAAPGRGFESFTCESTEVKGRRFTIRRAVESDLPALVALLRDDVLGAVREGSPEPDDAGGTMPDDQSAASVPGDSTAYARAFALIADDPNQLLVTIVDNSASVAGGAADAGSAVRSNSSTELNSAADPNSTAVARSAAEQNSAAVGSEADGRIVGTLQLSLVPSLSRRGTLRLQIEAVRIGAAAQGIGLGTAVFEWAHDCGRRFGAGLAQLTTDKSRADAQRFYAHLGYVASHEGLKLPLG